MTTISFPGLGIPEFTINPVAIPFGEGGIRWYALFIVTGMIFAVFYAQYRAKAEGINFDTIIDFAIFTIPIGIIGARLFYVLFDWIDVMVNNKPNPYQSFIDVIAIWEGGLAIYGGIIFGTITIFAVAKFKKLTWNRFFKILDAIAPGVMIAQAIGRWGNFCNGEAYGTPTSLPWRMCSDKFAYRLYSLDLIDLETKQQMLNGTLGVHPTFLYESLWNILGFILINIFYKKKRFDGQIVLMYFSWYGFGRMFIELLRTDSLTNGNNIRVSSLIGLLSFLIAGSLLLYFFIRNKGKRTFASDVITDATDITTNEIIEEETTENIETIEQIEADSPPIDTEIQNQKIEESKEDENNGKVD